MPDPQENPVTSSTSITDTSRVTNADPVTDTIVAQTKKITSKNKVKQPQKPAKPKIDTLILFDDEFSIGGVEALRDAYYPKAMLGGFKTWADIVKQLKKYSEIKTLVFNAHSIPGSLFVDGGSKTSIEQRDLLSSTGVKITQAVSFEGCSIMADPAGTALIVSGITAPKAIATGYTYFSITQSFTLQLTGTQTKEEIDKRLAPHRKYMLPNQNVPAANSDGSYIFYKRWFRIDDNEEIIAPNSDLKGIYIKPKIITIINTKADAEKMYKEDKKIPIYPFRKVIIRNIKAVIQ